MAVVQFNLLPDVKLQYVKSQRTKHLMTLVSFIVAAASLGLLLFMLFVVDVVQKKSIADLNKDIHKYSTQLKSTKDLDKILTVQNQLSTLTSLHESKPVTSRLFGYLTQLTPANDQLSKLTLDYQAGTMEVGGTAKSFDDIQSFTDTLKNTKYMIDGSMVSTPAFTQVVLTSFAKTDKGASFTISSKYAPDIFDVKKTVMLQPPTGVITSQSTLFQGGN